jgi:integrase/recombinase XerC
MPMFADAFIQYLTFEKRFSVHTITAYKNDLRQFSSFADSIYGITDSRDVSYQLIRSWLAQLIQTGTSPRSANRKLSTLKSYFRFLINRGYIEENPVHKVIAPKISKKLPVFVENEKMDKLLGAIAVESDFNSVLSRFVVEILYATGMRVAELIALKHKDIDMASMSLLVTGKRNKQRIIPFGSHLRDAITEFTLAKEKQLRPVQANDFLITTVKGKKAYPKLIYNIVTQSLQRITTQDKKSPHVLRHTFATSMLNNGADLNAIKELLGHSNLAATQVYTHNTIERIKHIYQQAHPKA